MTNTDVSLIVLSLALFSLTALPVAAQVSSAERIIQQQQEQTEAQRRLIQQQQRERSAQKPVPFNDATPGAVVSEGCFEIDSITLEGVDDGTLVDLDEVLAFFSNSCLGIAELNDLLKNINRIYFEAGYITSRAYLPKQNLQSGTLIVRVVEGNLETIKRQESESNPSESLLQPFPVENGDALNIRDLEQGLEQINRLSSRQAQMQLLPGATPGSSVVSVTEQVSKPWQVSTRFSNSGQQSTGEDQLQWFAGWDSPLGLYDYTYLSLQSDIRDRDSGREGRSVSWHWDIPIGYWKAGWDISYFDYISVVNAAFEDFESSGNSVSERLFIERLVYRDSDSKLRVATAVVRKTNENFIDQTLIESSSRRLSVAELSIELDQYFATGGQLFTALTYRHGTTWFGAQDDSDADQPVTDDTPKAQFNAYQLSIDYAQPLTLLGQRFQYRSRFSGQYSNDELFGSEAFSIGSWYTVRGYKEHSLSANSGAFLQNDLSWQWPTTLQWLRSLSSFIGLDAGVIKDDGSAEGHHQSLQGWAVGLNWQAQGWSGQLHYGRPINRPDEFRDAGSQLAFSVNAAF